MTTLTPEQWRAVESAGDSPVRLEDPETHETYVIVKAAVFDRLNSDLSEGIDGPWSLPDGVRRSKEAYRRELPRLLEQADQRGQWVAYHEDERIGVDPDSAILIRECVRRGLTADQYYVGTIAPPIVEPEQSDWSFFELEDSPPRLEP